VLQEAWSWRLKYPDCSVVIGGDLNTDLDKRNDASCCINNFINNHSLVRGDANFSHKRRQTYVNESFGHSSVIDYFICDTGDDIVDYYVLESEINISDHLPVVMNTFAKLALTLTNTKIPVCNLFIKTDTNIMSVIHFSTNINLMPRILRLQLPR